MHRIVVTTMLGAIGIVAVSAQSKLHLKARVPATADQLIVAAELSAFKSLTPNRRHRIVQFAGAPTPEDLKNLQRQGASVLQYVPDDAVLISAPDDFQGAASRLIASDQLMAVDKLSPEFYFGLMVAPLTKAGEEPRRMAVVELYPDIGEADARQIASLEGVRLAEHADLAPANLLVEATPAQLSSLAGWDEVAYIYPASEALGKGSRLHNCSGAFTQFGSVGQYVARVGEGWDGPGQNAATLKYAIAGIPSKLPADSARAEILRALAEWSRVVKLDFVAGALRRCRGADLLRSRRWQRQVCLQRCDAVASDGLSDPEPFLHRLWMRGVQAPAPPESKPVISAVTPDEVTAMRSASILPCRLLA